MINTLSICPVQQVVVVEAPEEIGLGTVAQQLIIWRDGGGTVEIHLSSSVENTLQRSPHDYEFESIRHD